MSKVADAKKICLAFIIYTSLDPAAAKLDDRLFAHIICRSPETSSSSGNSQFLLILVAHSVIATNILVHILDMNSYTYHTGTLRLLVRRSVEQVASSR